MSRRYTRHAGAKRNLALCLGLVMSVLPGGLPAFAQTRAEQIHALKIGDVAPELKVEKLLLAPPDADIAGKNLKGNVVVVEFWATWCQPCVPAIKHLNELAVHFKNKPVKFISITDEADETLIAKFLKEQPVMGWVGLDTDGSVFNAYKAGSRPHTVIVDRDGKIAAITHPNNVTAGVLDDLLAGKTISLPLKAQAGSQDMDVAQTGGELFQATIEPSTGSGRLYGGMLLAPGRIESDGLPLLPAISTAYRTSNYRIVESVPLPKDYYKFKILVPKGREELLYPVFQQALEVTFGLKVRREMREVDVFVLRPVEGQTASFLRPSQASESTPISWEKGFVRTKKQPIEKLAELLESAFLRRPVVDETGLEAEYDWDLPFNRASNNVLLDAIRAQLGIQVVSGKRRVEFLLIERVEQPATKKDDDTQAKRPGS